MARYGIDGARVLEPVVAPEFNNFQVYCPSDDGSAAEMDVTAAFQRYATMLDRYNEAASGERPGWMVEVDRFWKVEAGGNSGVFFHVGDEGSYVWETGPEMQVLDNDAHPDGRNPLTSAGSNYALTAPERDLTRPVGMWNEARLVVVGPRVEHWLHGEKLLAYELWTDAWKAAVAASKFAGMPRYGLAKTGRIALQDHGDRVSFRNVKIRPR